MTSRQRNTLQRLMAACNKLGGSLDMTATSVKKMIDRQRAHRQVQQVLYGVLMDAKENEQLEMDLEDTETALLEIEALATKEYK